uniref:Sugar transporter SWEET1 n=1 Tax=Acrobeloides nanus TaxID=290746 RepID=A0A914CA79_9BILA
MFTIPFWLERMVEEPITLLSVLSITAIVSTVSLFFCGIPICVDIWRRKSTDEISGFPFIMGFLGGTFWLRYGLLKMDFTMITVNVVGVTLMFTYTMFYVFYTQKRTSILLQVTLVFSLIASMLFLVQTYTTKVLDPLGFICMTFNIINFGAPLAGIGVVLRKKCCDTLPFPLCTANFLVSSQWCLYGFLVNDIYIIIPNAAGMGLAILQLSLFLIFPRAVGEKAVLSYCLGSCGGLGDNKDIAKKAMDKKDSSKRSFNILRRCCFRGSTTSCTSSSHPAPTILSGVSTDNVDEIPESMPLPVGENPKFDKIPELDDLEENWHEAEGKFAQSNCTMITNFSETDETDQNQPECKISTI